MEGNANLKLEEKTVGGSTMPQGIMGLEEGRRHEESAETREGRESNYSQFKKGKYILSNLCSFRRSSREGMNIAGIQGERGKERQRAGKDSQRKVVMLGWKIKIG